MLTKRKWIHHFIRIPFHLNWPAPAIMTWIHFWVQNFMPLLSQHYLRENWVFNISFWKYIETIECLMWSGHSNIWFIDIVLYTSQGHLSIKSLPQHLQMKKKPRIKRTLVYWSLPSCRELRAHGLRNLAQRKAQKHMNAEFADFQDLLKFLWKCSVVFNRWEMGVLLLLHRLQFTKKILNCLWVHR